MLHDDKQKLIVYHTRYILNHIVIDGLLGYRPRGLHN